RSRSGDDGRRRVRSDASGHGRTAGHAPAGYRRLRADFAPAVGVPRPRRPDRGQLSAGSQLAGHRPAADSAQGLQGLGGPRSPAAPGRAARGPEEFHRHVAGRRRRASAHSDQRRRSARFAFPRNRVGQARIDRQAHSRHRAAQHRGRRDNRDSRGIIRMATAPAAVSANKAELLAIADAVAREKLIDKGIVIEAMEDAIQRAARARYGAENDIRAKLDSTTGDLRLWRVLEVVEEPEDHFKQIDAKGAQKLQKGAKLGDFIVDPLPPIEFGRIAAQAAKQVIFQKVRDAERERQYEEFKDRANEVITGVVKRVEFGHIVVDLGRAEGVIRRDQQIPREMVRVGDRIRSLIMSVRREARGPQIFLSRAHPEFMKKLFAQEVPEIYDGIIEIKAAARDPGSRAKIGVISHDSSIDPVGACVGMKGSRVQAVVQELQGEKIDIIPWSQDLATFVVNALQPATVSRVVIDEEESRIEVVVPDDQLSLAIGRRGQNVRLASQLTISQIDILTEADASEKRQREFVERSALFQ